jgi:hypothetical protein
MRRSKKNPTINQLIIEKFLKDPNAIWKDKNSRMRELGTAKKLLDKYPNKRFWFRVNIPFEMESLLWFLVPKGKQYLLNEWNKFKLDLKAEKKYSIGSRKIGKAKKINKTKSLLEFLRDGSEKKQ